MSRSVTSSLLAAALLAGCGGDDARATAKAAAKVVPYDTLAEYGYFEADGRPAEGTVPYAVIAPLWADHAGKDRFVVLPKGETIGFDAGEAWRFPVGSVVIKTFAYPLDLRDPDGASRLLETRLLILDEAEGWTSHTYVWNEAATEAVRVVAGKRVTVAFTGEDGAGVTEDYLVPNTNQCNSCHERDDTPTFLGTITPQMNRDVIVGGQTKNQLAWMAEQGMFSEALPDPSTLPRFVDPFGDGDLDARARSYLHANCSHCHRPGGGGGPSGLVLLEWETDLAKRGVCKIPAAAGAGAGGHDYDIVPGDPDASIMPFRMGSVDPDIKMPELPNRVPDDRGIELVRAWITSLEPKGCM